MAGNSFEYQSLLSPVTSHNCSHKPPALDPHFLFTVGGIAPNQENTQLSRTSMDFLLPHYITDFTLPPVHNYPNSLLCFLTRAGSGISWHIIFLTFYCYIHQRRDWLKWTVFSRFPTSFQPGNSAQREAILCCILIGKVLGYLLFLQKDKPEGSLSRGHAQHPLQ